ncbi:MAG: type II secretion system F family protein [Acidobacteria bacterium]|nr:type II secretion system F family protein [Acidobacteriota bacterium]MBV9071702.1 type II secretion system F family protein [Acidobacteriota bacterium]MBV9187725.1 type II secretion system F family protein [Acidobacteriota bacterium]
MPEFIVRVGTPDGAITERHIQAMSVRAAEDELRQQGMHVFEARRGTVKLRDLLPRGKKIISTEMFLMFNQELLALVKAGLPILQSFDIMLERQKNLRFREVLTDVREKLKSGIALSDAFAAYGDAFPPIYSTSLRAGERSGDLEGVLRRFLRYQKIIVNLRKRVIGAMIYPSVLILLSIGMVFIMLVKVIPKFAEFYQGFGAELPWFTTLMIGVSKTLNTNLPILVIVLVGAYLLFRRWTKGSGRVAWDKIKLKLPLAGGILHRFAIMQFTQSLGTLLAGGTPMVPAIEIASQSVTNQSISGKIFGIVQNVREGEPLWRSLENTGAMSDLAVEMIKVGESTGALTEMLGNVSEFYDEEIESRLTRMVSAIEPMILVFMGSVIAILLYAFYLPLFQLSNVAQQ